MEIEMPTACANTLLGFVEIGGNRLLSMDEQALQRCFELQGHCIAVQFTDLDLNLYCYPGGWGMRLGVEAPARQVDATISGRLMALVNLATGEDKVSTSIQEGVSISGNASVAQQMQKLFTELDLDWEEALSQYTGDIAAYQIHRQARSASDWLRQTVASLSQTSSEYLREESRMSPTQVEFERFQQAAKTLKQDVDRAEVRLRHLMQAVSGKVKQ
jgi:ubiquinone biosynthesis protein UbiJ